VQVSARMVAYWNENGRRLSAFFHSKALRELRPHDLSLYQRARIDAGRAPKTVNGELSVLRQLLRHARLWHLFEDEYRPLRNTKPPIGQALTDEQQEALFAVARSRPEWMFAYVAMVLSFFSGMRACEILGLQWKHIDWPNGRLQIRRSKTPAGWRDPSLNDTSRRALEQLRAAASPLGFAEPEHFVFPYQGREKNIDPGRPMSGWRSAWRAIRNAAGLGSVRFHDGRHTVLTRLAEAGQPDWVIQAQMGHVSPAMMKTYSHIRRQALDETARVLEPSFSIGRVPGTDESADAEQATAQSTAQAEVETKEIAEIVNEFGSSGWIRTSNPPVNSRMLCR